ncbi:NAD-dependent epimerase/dehydratase family protein [Nakamurella deserti]|uniref:NAD-dependent epimerase/dehydratase family protein n=1 Tax=Nakamurella deserti TaxID=2164074 RepID=UPI000DBE0993|nr:NAD-dependent epimerase/dehydratase family protein [Nakamurella deserti]
MTATWVVGAGGLLGRGLVRELGARRVPVVTQQVPWSDATASRQALERGFARLREAAGDGPWRIAWCSGAGVTGTPAAVLNQEVQTFRDFLDHVARAPAAAGSALFLASSAGGVYAGAGRAPFTEAAVASSISPYGTAKLATEQVARDFAARTGVGVLVGRIANLYGPGQNLAKPQGLVSHICRSHLSGQPISVYVSLDTTRDYLYVDDCAAMICDGLERLGRERPGDPVTKILASQQGVTIGALLAETRRLFKRAPRVVLGSSPFAKFQVRDLRLRSVVWPELDRRSLTPLGVGIKATADDLLRATQLGDRAARR